MRGTQGPSLVPGRAGVLGHHPANRGVPKYTHSQVKTSVSEHFDHTLYIIQYNFFNPASDNLALEDKWLQTTSFALYEKKLHHCNRTSQRHVQKGLQQCLYINHYVTKIIWRLPCTVKCQVKGTFLYTYFPTHDLPPNSEVHF